MSQLSGIRFGGIIASAAAAHGLDPTLLAAVAAQETGGPGATSGRNVVGDGGHGHGLFQIDDRYHAFASTAAAMNPARNADYAASMLQSNLAATGGNVRQALSMYNAGSATATGTKTTWADGSTLGYADSVLRHATAIGADVAGGLAGDLKDGVADDAESVGGLAAVAQTLLGTSGTGTSAASTAAAPLTDPGALQMGSPVTQNGYTYHSYASETQAGSSAATDADKKIGSLIDGDSGIFDGDAGDDT